MRGTVKAHNKYKDVKQTVITYCKVLNDFINRKVEVKENLNGNTVARVVECKDSFIEAKASVEQSA
jgi:hypothetical protein